MGITAPSGSSPGFFVTPGYGERMLRLFGYSQAVRIGDRVEISGQGGWSDDIAFPEALVDEIAQAFGNVGRTLATAGATWSDVVSVVSYHVDLDRDRKSVVGAMTERFRHHMPDHQPIWTCLGVAALADPKMRVEIRVSAVVSG